MAQRSTTTSSGESSDEIIIMNKKTDLGLESRSRPSLTPSCYAQSMDVPASAPEAQILGIGGQATFSSAAAAGGACAGSVMQTDDEKLNSSRSRSRFPRTNTLH